VTVTAAPTPTKGLVGQFERGLDAPICLTWELTYACNLSCVHCLSSSGRRDRRELSTAEFTGMPLDGPDPECVQGYGADALLARASSGTPKPSGDHSIRTSPRDAGSRRSRQIPVTIGSGPRPRPVSACEENPLAGFAPQIP